MKVRGYDRLSGAWTPALRLDGTYELGAEAEPSAPVEPPPIVPPTPPVAPSLLDVLAKMEALALDQQRIRTATEERLWLQRISTVATVAGLLFAAFKLVEVYYLIAERRGRRATSAFTPSD